MNQQVENQGYSFSEGMWYAAFVAGLILFIYGLFCFFVIHRKKENRFSVALLFEFLSCWVLHIPSEINDAMSDGFNPMGFFEGIVTAFLKTITKAMGEGYERIHPDLSTFFIIAYSTLLAMATIVMLLFAAGVVLFLLNGPLQRIQLALRGKRVVFFFPEVNEKTLSIARSISGDGRSKWWLDPRSDPDTPAENVKRKWPDIIFLGDAEELDKETLKDIEDMGGFIFDKNDIDMFMLLKKHALRIETFLFCGEEKKNLNLLNRLCNCVKNEDNSKMMFFYVELEQTPWAICDSLTALIRQKIGKDLTINYIRTNENFILNDLYTHSIFEHVIEQKEADFPRIYTADFPSVKLINFLLVGMNERNMEMMKAVLHLGQMPGYKINLMVVEDGNSRGYLQQMMPEILARADREGDALYSVDHREGIDLNAIDLENLIEEKFPNFTFCFINTENDQQNMRIAMRINALAYRLGRDGEYKIQVNIFDHALNSVWKEGGFGEIEAVGDVRETYNYNFITMSQIESAAIKLHKVRQAEKQKKDPQHKIESWNDYCNKEYNRRSVYARMLSLKYKCSIIRQMGKDLDLLKNRGEDDVWSVYEHMRWDVYTRTMGYQSDPKMRIKNRLTQIEEEFAFGGDSGRDAEKDSGKDSGKEENRNTASGETLKERLDKLDNSTRNAMKTKKASEKTKIRTEGMLHECLVDYSELDQATKSHDGVSMAEMDVLRELFWTNS